MKIIILTLSLLIITTGGLGQTSALTYQGRLTDGPPPANGTYEMRFSLFDDPVAGTQAGPTIELTNVQVAGGIFTVQLSFGTDPFPFGESRFMQIEVRRNSGEAYTPLAPRQHVTATPYAIRTLIANAAENAYRLGNIDAAEYVVTTDPRMSDARPPTAGSPNYIQNQAAIQSGADFNISGTGESSIFNARSQFDLNGSRILGSPGTLNTLVGINTGTALTSGERNTFVGRNTGVNTTTGNTNTFVGSGAGFENISGSQNSLFGYNAGLRVTSGSQNSIFGVSAGSANLIGNNNAMFGFESGLLTTGGLNSFFGSGSGRSNTSGEGNSFFGREAGLGNVSGGQNVFLGRLAGQSNTAGSFNTFVGAFAGNVNTTGGDNTALGVGANFATGNLTNATAIGAGTIVSTSDTIQLGRSNGDDRVTVPGDLHVDGNITGGGSLTFVQNRTTGIQSANFNISGTGEAQTYNARTAYEVASEPVLLRSVNDIWVQNLLATGGIDFRSEPGVSALYISPNSLVRVRTTTGGVNPICLNADFLAACSSSIRYKENVVKFSSSRQIINLLRPVSFDWKSNGQQDLGLVAEEVAKVEPLLVTYNDKGEVEGVKYDRIGVVLVDVVKEQQSHIESQTAASKELRSKVEALEKKLDDQRRQIEALRSLVCGDKADVDICRKE